MDLFEIRRVRSEQTHETDFWNFFLGKGQGWRNQACACVCTHMHCQSCTRFLMGGRFGSVLSACLPVCSACLSAFTWICSEEWNTYACVASGCCAGHTPISRGAPGILFGVCRRLCYTGTFCCHLPVARSCCRSKAAHELCSQLQDPVSACLRTGHDFFMLTPS